MFKNLLSMDTTQIVVLISMLAIVLIIAAFSIIAAVNKKQKFLSTKMIVFGGITIAASFALSFFKIENVYGGAITLASFVPILIFVYAFGFVPGLVVGLIFGLLIFIQAPYILTPLSFALDYILPFMMISFMALPKLFIKNETANILVGVFVVYLFRYIMHVFSGLIYFNAGWIVDGLPHSNGWIYSMLYNASYIVPDMIICMVVFFILSKTKALDRILKIIND